jgi:hypothetical protein
VSARASAAHASVVFLKITGFAQEPVAEQALAKERLEGALAAALEGVEEAARIVLEAPDGAVVVVLGNPAAALDVARRVAAGASGLRLAAGINHGPVRVVDAGTIVVGDGITVAETVAGFAPLGRVAATLEFRDALRRAAPGRARYLASAGTHTDARDRSYHVFLADENAARKRRRQFAVLMAIAFGAIIALGLAARLGPRARPDPIDLAASGARPSTPLSSVPVPVPAPRAASEALATVRLDVKPQGELYIDGASKGKSPPITSIQIAPGRHTIELRRAGSSTLVLQVEAGPGEQLSIRHSFVLPAPKSAWRRFFDQFK